MTKLFCFLCFIFTLSGLFEGCSYSKQVQTVNAQSISVKPTEPLSQIKPVENDIDTSISGIKSNVSEGIVLPGEKIGQLSLGNTKEFALSYLGKPTEEYSYTESTSCIREEVHWNDYKLKNSGIFAYLKDNKIYYVESFTERFKTISGIKPLDSPRNLVESYPSLVAYELLYSGGIINGGKNIIYWVDEKQGIAFGIYYYPKKGKRIVGSIIVFNSGDKFQPRGCISPPQEFVSRKKWYLD